MPSNPLTLWVVASFAAHTVGANVWWYGFTRDAERAAYWMRHPVWRTLTLLTRIGFFVGVPYLALIRGIVTPAQFALGVPDWERARNDATPLTLGAFVVVALLIWLHAHTLLSRYPPGVYPAALRRAQFSQPWGISFVLLEALCLQAHWLLVRAGATAFFNGDVPMGVIGGFGLVVVEWLLDPHWRHDVRRLGHIEDRALVGALAIFSAAFILIVGNFWLLLLGHVALWLGWLWLMQMHVKPRAARET